MKPKALAVHRWQNGFELHGLPELPARGAVGLLGGAGKTTAMLVLAGRLEPSCGWYALRERYSSQATPARHDTSSSPSARYHTLGKILRKLEAQQLSTSYKPQAVERLRHLPDLHRNLADLKLDFETVQALRLGGYDSKDAEQLDASELQRVSVAAALSKDAELYLLDCPSEHLDIVQRRQVAKLIKEKGKQSLIIVADNDITFLRWACDSVAIFYGDESWGTPSELYSAKDGIGAFVEGVLPDEQLRIRLRGRPGESPAEREKRLASQHERLLELSGVQKQFDGNVLRVDGEIRTNERVGLLGADGTGKSTLLKIIAGKEDFSGLVRGKARIAFKSQHLAQRAVLKGVPKEFVRALGIPTRGRPRLTASLRQRIAIARCLGADADLYVLDQPSDGLTAEERLVVAELLRAKRCAIVADHDAWLVARVADRCGLFMKTDGRSNVEWMSAEAAIERISE